MKIVNLILAILFVSFAIVQYNDPDPWLWITLYLFIGAISAFAAFGKYSRPILIGGILICIVGILILVPEFVHWIQTGAESIVESMKTEKPHIEFVREFLGLFICLITLLFHYSKSKQLTGKK